MLLSNRFPRHLGRAALALTALAVAISGCNFIDIVRGRHAKLVKMVPGGNVANGQVDCWLTFQFDRHPDGIDLRDVRVRFDSIALQSPAEFDWAYIAKHDVVAGGSAFGSGHRDADMTKPGEAPPLGQPTKVRFPLRAKRRIDQAPSTLWLEAELYWGGKKQDSVRRSLEHVYARTADGFF